MPRRAGRRPTSSSPPPARRGRSSRARTSRRSAAGGAREPLFIIDIAVPRDVEPSVGDIEQVFLYNVDDLQARRAGEPQPARRRDRARRSDRRRGGRRGSRRGSARAARCPPSSRCGSASTRSARAELQRLEGKLAALSPEARARVDEVTRLIVEKLLLEPTEQLKALPDEETQVAYTEAREPAVPAARRRRR